MLFRSHLSFSLFGSDEPLIASATGNAANPSAVTPPGEQLAQALRQAEADGQPVFIDFWASWCKNCSAMEHTTFAAAPVKQRLADYRVVRLQTERPSQPAAKELLDHFKVLGLPAYVVLSPKNANPPSSERHLTSAAAGR